MTIIHAAAGSTFHIGPQNSTAEDEADYEGLTYVKVTGAGGLGEFGPNAALITWEGLDDDYVTKAKGIRNAGAVQLQVAWNPLDPGQKAMIAAEGTKFLYAFKTTAADAADANDPDSIWYFKALVMTAVVARTGPNNVMTLTCNCEISGPILPILSEAVT